jgi:UDP-glucose 4-epimerase
MTRRILVTGGAGFIGSHAAALFAAAGDHVTVLDDLSSGRRENIPTAAEFLPLDVRSPDAARAVRDGRFDVVCHFAAQMDVRRSVADPVHDARINIEGSLNLLEAVRAAGGSARVVFASTGGAIYGDLAEPPTAEQAAKDPQSPYGVAKLAVEQYLAYYGRVHGLQSIALRFSNVYGPRQDPHGEAGVVAIFCERLLHGEPLTVYGDGRQTRDYVFVGDVARAVQLGARAAVPPAGTVDARAFNIGTGVETDVLTLARILTAAAGAPPRITHAAERPGEQRRSAVRIDAAARALGWRPEVALEQGLQQTFAWFSARRPAVLS